MSIHGAQKFLPFVLDEKNKPLEKPADYAIAFKKIIDNKKNGENLITFSRLAWPLIMIHGSLTAHLIFDDVGISNLDVKITNPPRQATIGHILRNIDNRSYEEMLERIKQVILYTEKGNLIASEENKDEEVEEYKNIHIQGIMNPDLVNGLTKIIKKLKTEPIKEYALLESQYSVEIGLNLASKYKEYTELIIGNRIRWEGLNSLIQEPFDRWIKELNAQIKDTELRYKSNLNKEQKQITKEEANRLLAEEKDKQAQMNLQKKKNILEKMGGSFLAVDTILEELRESNKQFLDPDAFKLTQIDKAVNSVKNQIKNIQESTNKINEKIQKIKESTDSFIQEMKTIDEETAENIRRTEIQLNTRLSQKNSRIKSISEASETFIKDLQTAKQSLQQKLNQIKGIIDDKITECENDLKNIKKWGMQDDVSGVSQSVLRIFLPVFGALFEDDDMEERLVFVFPQKVIDEKSCTTLDNGFSDLKSILIEKTEDDMKIRSNFEFTMEKKNFLLEQKSKKILKEGFKILESNGICTSEEIQKYLAEIKD